MSCLRNVNQLIVGPRVWAYQVLRETLGERFMENFQTRIFINHFLIQVIAMTERERKTRRDYEFLATCNRYSLQTLRSLGSFSP
jgi:hypothetical protein